MHVKGQKAHLYCPVGVCGKMSYRDSSRAGRNIVGWLVHCFFGHVKKQLSPNKICYGNTKCVNHEIKIALIERSLNPIYPLLHSVSCATQKATV